jgi:hypothetical protein
VWNIEKKIIFPRGYAKIHIRRPFFDNKKNIYKIIVLKIQKINTYSSTSSTHNFVLFLRITKISIFGGISKFLKLIVFGQILAVLGRFGQTVLH